MSPEHGPLPQEQQRLFEAQARAFAARLREFHDGLPGDQHSLLNAILEAARGAPTPSEDEPAAATTILAEGEVASFLQRLQAFHDGLPDDQHRFVDALVAQAGGREAEVRAYHGTELFSFPSALPPEIQSLFRAECSRRRGHFHVDVFGSPAQIVCWKVVRPPP